jgi:hypothetical protein
MELNTITLGDFTKLAQVLWLKGLESVPMVARSSGIFKEVNIPNNTGDTREFSEIDLEQFAKLKDQSDQAARARVQQGYTKTLTLYRVALDIGISYEMRTRNKAPEVVARLTNLGSTASNRMELDMTHRFTFGTATSYTDMDGQSKDISTGDTLALFYTAHTLRGSSTTYRNRLANNPQVSKGAIEGMERLIAEETYNQFGEKVPMPFDIIFTSDDPNTVNTVREYLQSTASLDSGANSGVVNVYKGKYRHVILPYLATTATGAPDATKRRYWGLVSSTMSSMYFAVHEEPHLKTPAPLNAGEDFSTDDWNFGVRAGYGIVSVGAAYIKFSSGDGTA